MSDARMLAVLLSMIPLGLGIGFAIAWYIKRMDGFRLFSWDHVKGCSCDWCKPKE